MSRDRSTWKKEQTTPLAPGEKRTNVDQKSAFNEQVKRYGLLDGSAADQFFVLGPNEQAHHLKPLRSLDGLYANTTPDQAKVLSNILGGSGNQIANLYAIDERAHQGRKGENPNSVHNLNRKRGLEQGAPQAIRSSLLKELDEAADMPFRYKVRLAERFKQEMMPQLREAYDDAMTDYYEPSKQSQIEARWRAIQYINSQSQLPLEGY